MDDLIRRKSILDKFQKICDSCGKYEKYNGVMCRACEFDDAKAIVEEEPPAQPDNQINLCDSCDYSYPDCPSKKDDVIFGNNIGNDNICACNKYKLYTQPEDWMERNKERILQAGMEGREIEFRIGGRLFAIREKAQ